MQVDSEEIASLAAGAALSHVTLSVAAIFILAVLIFMGVVLPAVWSAKPCRRKAAGAVLEQILDCIRKRP